jgi:hypothetical protein
MIFLNLTGNKRELSNAQSNHSFLVERIQVSHGGAVNEALNGAGNGSSVDRALTAAASEIAVPNDEAVSETGGLASHVPESESVGGSVLPDDPVLASSVGNTERDDGHAPVGTSTPASHGEVTLPKKRWKGP